MMKDLNELHEIDYLELEQHVLAKTCDHDDAEYWCDPCGKPAGFENQCMRGCGPVAWKRCIDCDEIFELMT